MQVVEHILTFGSAHKALKAESVLKRQAVAFRLLPGPKALIEHCDLVISVEEGALNAARQALAASGVQIKSIYIRDGENYVKV